MAALSFLVIRDIGGEREIVARGKGRVDVDEVDFAGEFGEQRGQDVFLVAPNEAVAPLAVAAMGEEVERELALAGGLVDRLHRLERQRHAHGRDALAIGGVLAVPHQLRHALLLSLTITSRGASIAACVRLTRIPTTSCIYYNVAQWYKAGR